MNRVSQDNEKSKKFPISGSIFFECPPPIHRDMLNNNFAFYLCQRYIVVDCKCKSSFREKGSIQRTA